MSHTLPLLELSISRQPLLVKRISVGGSVSDHYDDAAVTCI